MPIVLLAATSSSRSDIVTQFFRPFVRPLFTSLVSLKSVEYLECHKASESVKGTQWQSICVSRAFMGVSRKFQGSFKGVLRKFQGCFKEVSRRFQGCFKEVSRKF